MQKVADERERLSGELKQEKAHKGRLFDKNSELETRITTKDHCLVEMDKEMKTERNIRFVITVFFALTFIMLLY